MGRRGVFFCLSCFALARFCIIILYCPAHKHVFAFVMRKNEYDTPPCFLILCLSLLQVTKSKESVRERKDLVGLINGMASHT